MIYDAYGNILIENSETPYPEADCRTAFMAEVNKKAASIGMSNSTFASPSGLTGGEQTTAADMALLVMIASGYKELAEVWSKNKYYVTPRNRDVTIELSTTVKNTTLENSYPILGGKTGSVSTHKTLACLCNVNGKQVAGYVAEALSDGDRFNAMKELMDIASTIIGGGSTSATVTKASNAVALLVPDYYPLNYEQQTPTTLYTQGGTTSIVPASTVKLITAVTMLDWVTDMNKTFKFVSGDNIAGSGAVFNTGDVISFKDALYALMLPSSNMTAQAVARVVGQIILNRNGSQE